MRAPFIHTSSWAYGPQSLAGPPGTVYATGVQCRFVPQNEIQQFDVPYKYSSAWLTVDALVPNLPVPQCTEIGKVFYNWFQSDRVIVSARPTDEWYVARLELVDPRIGGAYWRVLLVNVLTNSPAFWPPLVPCPCVGSPCGCGVMRIILPNAPLYCQGVDDPDHWSGSYPGSYDYPADLYRLGGGDWLLTIVNSDEWDYECSGWDGVGNGTFTKVSGGSGLPDTLQIGCVVDGH